MSNSPDPASRGRVTRDLKGEIKKRIGGARVTTPRIFNTLALSCFGARKRAGPLLYHVKALKKIGRPARRFSMVKCESERGLKNPACAGLFSQGSGASSFPGFEGLTRATCALAMASALPEGFDNGVFLPRAIQLWCRTRVPLYPIRRVPFHPSSLTVRDPPVRWLPSEPGDRCPSASPPRSGTSIPDAGRFVNPFSEKKIKNFFQKKA